MTRGLLTLAVLVLATAVHAAPAPPGVTMAVTDRPSRLPAAFANGVTADGDIVYARPTGYRALELDLYRPPASAARPAAGFPLIVYIHGGAWLAGDRRHCRPFVDFPGVLASLAARGYIVASLEYRLSGEAQFPTQVQDVKAAIRWLRLHSADYSIDPTRVITWGVSAGGYLAVMAAASCGGLEKAPHSGGEAPSDCVQGAVSWYGLYDFATLAGQARQAHAMSRADPAAPEWRLLGCMPDACKRGLVAAASAVTYLGRKTPPMLLIVGDEDHLIPERQTLEMAARLAAVGVPHRLMVVNGADHSLMGKTLAETQAANLAALDATYGFIDNVVRLSR